MLVKLHKTLLILSISSIIVTYKAKLETDLRSTIYRSKYYLSLED